jgi:predicted nucleotidyltransferase
MDISAIIESKREEILKIAAEYGALNVRVFGSVSRSEAGPESDVDFLIELEPGRTLLDHAALYLELKQLLGREVDVVTEKGLRPKIRDRVLREAIPI